LNADLASGIKGFRFADLITSFSSLNKLSIHFSDHIELNQRILHSTDAQKLLDIILVELKHLKVLNIFTFPPVTISVKSESLTELGLFKSDLTQIVRLVTPALRKLNIDEKFRVLLFCNLSSRSYQNAVASSVHKNLFSVVYSGCPQLEFINKHRFPSQWEGGARVSKQQWISLITNKFIVRR